ncbi:peptidoglycan DD-metalloendopeptidase family protein [Thiocystis violacea]|uniref:peptidoglycan DD-metalloendopeptidase family protein n=1 Tax=Thiocystis violacea TaxID=13725 RepID=UPI001903EAD6|nr:peptidoglycan DD-metalloendopeptidase family protein [Thiocystis violacea]MBK1718474.1 peptidase M23 [Thiocystis violacea]
MPGAAARGRIALRLFALTMLMATLIGGCSTQPPAPVLGWSWSGPVPDGYYLVRGGDSLGQVAERLGIGLSQLAHWNRLKPPYRIYADTLLRIAPPDGSPPVRTARRLTPPAALGDKPRVARKPARQSPVATATRKPGRRAAPVDGSGSRRGSSGLEWEWPLTGPLVRTFRDGDRTRQGLRIGARAGEHVRSSADGQVVYSGSGLKGYGNLIIVKHNDKYLSAYGFNRRLLVAEGERVKRGQVVAEVGQGADGAYLLHFEVRRDGLAVDPMLYLPKRN